MRLCFIVMIFAASAASAQLGAVTGHVSCSDSNAPARLTDVVLMPVPDITPPGSAPGEKRKVVTPMLIYKTSLDGSFTMPSVRPGRYYVVGHKIGYLVPETRFTASDFQNPDKEMQAEIARYLPLIDVRANQTTQVDLRLVPAGSISGSIRYDDGTSADDARVSIDRQDAKGEWFRLQRVDQATHGAAQYSLQGLAAGVYRLNLYLSVMDRVTDSLFGESGTTAYTAGYGLAMYDGDTFFQKDARTITLKQGEKIVDHDFTIPVAKLHSVSGSVVEQRTGQPVNSGNVMLVGPDGMTTAYTSVHKDDATFRFPFVPEGTYRIRVTQAREIAREPLPPGKTTYEQLVPQYRETTCAPSPTTTHLLSCGPTPPACCSL